MFLWDSTCIRTDSSSVPILIIIGETEATVCLLGLAYLKPATDGYPRGQPVGAGSGSSVPPGSGVYVDGWPMAKLCNFIAEQAAHVKIWYVAAMCD